MLDSDSDGSRGDLLAAQLVEDNTRRLKSIIRGQASPGIGTFAATTLPSAHLDMNISPDEANEISSTLDRVSNKLKMRMAQGVDIQTTAASPPGQTHTVHIDSSLLLAQAQQGAHSDISLMQPRRDLSDELNEIEMPEEDQLLRHLEEKLAEVTQNTVGPDELLTEAHATRLIEKTKRLVVDRRQEIVKTQERLDGALKELNTARQQENLLLQSRIAVLKKHFKERVVEFEREFLKKAEMARQEMLDKIMEQKAQCELAIEAKADALIAAVQVGGARQVLQSTMTTTTTQRSASRVSSGGGRVPSGSGVYGGVPAHRRSLGVELSDSEDVDLAGLGDRHLDEVGLDLQGRMPGGGSRRASAAGRIAGGVAAGDWRSMERLERRLHGAPGLPPHPGAGGHGSTGRGGRSPPAVPREEREAEARQAARVAARAAGRGHVMNVDSPRVREHYAGRSRRGSAAGGGYDDDDEEEEQGAGWAGREGRPRGTRTMSPERAHRVKGPLEKRQPQRGWIDSPSPPPSGGRGGAGGARDGGGSAVRWVEPTQDQRRASGAPSRPGKGLVRVSDLMSDSDSEM